MQDSRKFWGAVLIALALIIILLMVNAPKSQMQVIVNLPPTITADRKWQEVDLPPAAALAAAGGNDTPRPSPPAAVMGGRIDLLAPAASGGCKQVLKARREHVRIPSLELALIQKQLRVMVDVGSPSSGLSLFVATSPSVFVFSFGVEARMSHLLPKRPNWSINPVDYTVIGPHVDFLILQAWDAFMPVVRHVLNVGQPAYVIVLPLGPQCTDLRPLLGEYRCTSFNKFVQCER